MIQGRPGVLFDHIVDFRLNDDVIYYLVAGDYSVNLSAGPDRKIGALCWTRL
ncbi:hypothetical protein MCACPph1_CDS0042 [Moorella phage MCACPph1]